MSEWQPIETAPKVEGPVILVSVPAKMGPYVQLAVWWDEWWRTADDYLPIEPSHWIAIPPHPEAKENG